LAVGEGADRARRVVVQLFAALERLDRAHRPACVFLSGRTAAGATGAGQLQTRWPVPSSFFFRSHLG
jgi:hypothetical protein